MKKQSIVGRRRYKGRILAEKAFVPPDFDRLTDSEIQEAFLYLFNYYHNRPRKLKRK